jgi:hypothetical protein
MFKTGASQKQGVFVDSISLFEALALQPATWRGVVFSQRVSLIENNRSYNDLGGLL